MYCSATPDRLQRARPAEQQSHSIATFVTASGLAKAITAALTTAKTIRLFLGHIPEKRLWPNAAVWVSFEERQALETMSPENF